MENVESALDHLTPEEIEVCNKCGSPEIEVRMWVNVNTNEVKSSCDDSETFCNGCEEIIRLNEITTLAKYDDENETTGFPRDRNQITAQKFHDATATEKNLDAFKYVIEHGKSPE